MPGADKEVGRLSIRVVPDMTGFRERVAATAKDAGKDVEIPVDADISKAERKIHEVADKDYNSVVDLDADTGKAKAKIEEATRPRKVNVKVDYDEGALDKLKKNIDRFLTNESLEMGKAHQRLQQVFRDAAPKPQKFDLKLDDAFDYNLRNRVQRVTAAAARDAEREFAKVSKVAERELAKVGGGGRDNRSGLSLLLDSIGNKVGNFKTPDLVPNIGGLGAFGSIGIIVAGLSLLAPALALVSQALVGLPALVAGVALPIGVMAIGFKGIKEALDASGFLDIITGKSKKDGTKGKDKTEPGQIIKDMQEKVSDTFKTGLTPVFQQIAGILPKLTQGFPFVANGLVKIAEGMGNILSTPGFQDGFDRFTNSVGTMLTNLSPAFQLFTSAMSNLIFNVGDHLPGFANTMTEWAGQFQNWVDRISKPKQDWFGKDVPNSSTLDQAVSNMKPVLNGIKDFVGDLLAKGLQLANDPNLITGITDFFTGVEHLAEQVARMGPIFENLAFILGKIPGGSDPLAPTKDAPYGLKPAPPGSAHPGNVPITRDEAMNTQHGFWDDPGEWFDQEGAKFKESLKNGFKNIPKTLGKDAKALAETFNNIFGLSSLNPDGGGSGHDLFGPTGSARANADATPFNPGTRTGQPPIPVVPVGPTGSPNPASLFPGGPGNPIQPHPPAAQPPVAPGGAQGQIAAPKIEVPKLPPGSEKIWEPLIASTQQATGTVTAAVDGMVAQITGKLQAVGPAASAAGQSVGTGMAAGIAASAPSAIAAAQALGQGVIDAMRGPKGVDAHSPSVKGHKTGQDTAQGFDDGLSEGFQGVIEKAGALAGQVNDAMAQGGILSPHLKAQVAKETAAIGVEYDKLKEQAQGLDKKDPQRKSIQEQMKQLQALRTSLGADSKESAYNAKYGSGAGQGDSTQQAASMITQALASGLDAMKGFAMANVTQLEGDLGMSGNGVVEKLGDYGLNFLTGTLNSVAQSAFGGGKGGGGNTYNFQSMDSDGMQKNYERVKNRESMQHTQRTN